MAEEEQSRHSREEVDDMTAEMAGLMMRMARLRDTVTESNEADKSRILSLKEERARLKEELAERDVKIRDLERKIVVLESESSEERTRRVMSDEENRNIIEEMNNELAALKNEKAEFQVIIRDWQVVNEKAVKAAEEAREKIEALESLLDEKTREAREHIEEKETTIEELGRLLSKQNDRGLVAAGAVAGTAAVTVMYAWKR